MTVLLPPAGQSLLVVHTTTGARLSTLVDDDLSPDCLLVHPPLGTGGVPVATLPAGSPLLLGWTTAGGRHELDAVLVEVQRERIPLWRLAAEGETRTTQLRRYARAADSLQGELTRGRDTWSAVLSDIGEGGARALVQDARGLATGDEVLLYITVEGQRLQLPGRVLPFVLADVGRTELRLEFAGIGRAADLLRRRVFEQQIRARGAHGRRSRT
jgi:PilZ domain